MLSKKDLERLNDPNDPSNAPKPRAVLAKTLLAAEAVAPGTAARVLGSWRARADKRGDGRTLEQIEAAKKRAEEKRARKGW